MLDPGSRGPGSQDLTLPLCCVLGQIVYSKILREEGGGVTCDVLASHAGGVAILQVALVLHL